jgi:hypothetical protein
MLQNNWDNDDDNFNDETATWRWVDDEYTCIDSADEDNVPQLE